MPATLLIAPAAQGKTEQALRRIDAARTGGAPNPVAVLLPGRVPLEAFRARLAARGPALGVRLFTFYELYSDLLAQAGGLRPQLEGAVQTRLLQRLAARLAAQGQLPYFTPLLGKPGFPATLRETIEVLKRARLAPEVLAAAVGPGAEPPRASLGPRLAELAAIYDAYQGWLLEKNWADPEGLGWLCALALAQDPRLAGDWRLLVVDGFDEFNPTQLAVLGLLAGRAQDTLITLTGEARPRLAQRRFQRAAKSLAAELPQLVTEYLPPLAVTAPELHFVEANLFELAAPYPRPPAHVTFLQGQTRAVEARAALRWLKQRLVEDHFALGELAVLARALEPYRPFLEETAREFGLPLRVVGGVPLAENPAVSALLGVLDLPASRPAWPPRALLAALRSPYFDWGAAGIDAAQAAALDTLSRQARIQGGLEQWRAALSALAAAATAEAATPEDEPENGSATPLDAAAAGAALERLAARLTPPARAPLADYIRFVEDLVGDDPTLTPAPADEADKASDTLAMVARAQAEPATAGRDLAALRSFKAALRGLALAAAVLDDAEVLDYASFSGALREAVAAASYQPSDETGAGLLVASILDARGLSFRAVALLGLAEGEFPQAEREMPLLRDADRAALSARGARLEPHLRGDEITLFYEAVTRAREQLLVSRPYLADDGQAWEPSTYWRQLWELLGRPEAVRVRPEDPLPAAAVASAAEWVEQGYDPQAIAHGLAVFQAREAARAAGPFEGELPELATALAARYPPEQSWSASRLEAYGTCGFFYYVAHALQLEPRAEPEAGYDARSLGSMYHTILQKLYAQAADPHDLAALLARLPEIAQAVFATAPTLYGFRPTVLWQQQQTELLRVLRDTVTELAGVSEGWTPRYFEQRFGFHDAPLVIDTPGGPLRLHGVIDRIDVNATGQLRLIDYKTSGAPIAAGDLEDGRQLQLPLYALGATDALRLGEVEDGFYWHIGAARASSLKLAKYEGGVAGALTAAKEHLAAHVAGIYGGQFQPQPPEKGCPSFCPAAGFCWRYTPRRF